MAEKRAEEDPVIETQLERALAPYRDMVPAEVLEEMRALLSDALATHPTLAPLVQRLRPAKHVASSREVESDDQQEEKETKAPTKRGKAGSRGKR
jgi:hypothetical protein